MQSPFKIFRKYQKVALAALTLMAMIAFGLGDVIRQMGGGVSREREGKVIFETNLGNLTEIEMHRLIGERQAIYRFIGAAFMTVNPKMNPRFADFVVEQYGFGGMSESDMLTKWIYRHEADKLGITVSRLQVQEYINQFTGFGDPKKKLNDKQFQKIVQDLNISSKQLYAMLRNEMEIRTARMLTNPEPLPSPESYWEHFQHLNTREKIAVAAIPVSNFTEKTGEPTDAQIAELFNKSQYQWEAAYNGEFHPGFLQPQKVKLHYLEIARDDAEKKVQAGSPVTDKEIDDYYEANKATKTWLQEPPPPPDDDKTPIDPEITPEAGEKPVGKGPKLNPSDDPQADEKPAKPQTKEGEPDEKPDAEKGEQRSKDSDCLTDCKDDESEDAANDNQGAKKDADVGSPEASEKGAKPKASEGDDNTKPAAGDDDVEGEDGKAATKKGETKPEMPAPPELKFKPLDDELRGRIREAIISERISEKMRNLTDSARSDMSKVAGVFADSKEIKLVDPDEKQLVELERVSEAELRKIGEKLGMTFHKTGLVSYVELNEIPSIGRAFDPEAPMSFQGRMTTIMDQAFSGDGLCQPFESETFGMARYVCWKVQDVPAHIPELKDPGIREQVVAAWKRLEARKLAEKRASELAQKAKSSDKNLQTALSDETVTGASVGPALVITESADEFSYWKDSSVADPMSMRSRQSRVMLGNPGIDKAGPKFMQVIFDQLADGETGVAFNDDASICYVVQVFGRRPADREEFKDAKLFDPGSAYASIIQNEMQIASRERSEHFRTKYAIRMKEIPSRRNDRRSMMFDDE